MKEIKLDGITEILAYTTRKFKPEYINGFLKRTIITITFKYNGSVNLKEIDL
jgi:hypothetical protein